jgi:lysine-N-methylase
MPADDAPILATRYMTRFRCTGDTCEDTCCQVADWTVAVLEPDYRRVQTALADSDEDRAKFGRMFELIEQTGGARPFAVLRPRDDGHCTLLGDDKWCELHRRFGEPVLPTPCAMYPRVLTRVGERYELSGRLSCPEVARLCLLARDGIDAVPAAPDAVGRGFVSLTVDASPESHPYVEAFEPVREVLVGLLSIGKFPWTSRVFFVAVLAHTLHELFRPDLPPCEPTRIGQALREIGRREMLESLHERFVATDGNDELVMTVVSALVRARLERAGLPALRRVTAAAALGARPLDEAVRTHAAGRRRGGEALAARAELWFGNYCRNYFIQDWYLQSPSLLDHVMKLVVRTAMVRALFFAHPKFEQALLALDQESACDALAVEIVYSVTRAFDHNESIRAQLARTIAQHQLSSLAHAAAFLKF